MLSAEDQELFYKGCPNSKLENPQLQTWEPKLMHSFTP